MVGVCIVLLVIGVLSYVLAESKNRDKWLWFWGGVLLGPIALLVLIFSKKCLPEIEGGYQVCPFCRSTIPGLATVCSQCTRELPKAVTTHP